MNGKTAPQFSIGIFIDISFDADEHRFEAKSIRQRTNFSNSLYFSNSKIFKN